MKPRNLLIAGAAVLAWLSCASPDGAPTASTEDVTPPAEALPDNWHDVMEEVVGYGFDEVLALEADKSPEDMDLPAVQSTASHMARAMALGYAALELEDVPDFGKLARRSEDWLQRIADAAGRGDGATARSLILDGQFENCEDCHDAADEAGH